MKCLTRPTHSGCSRLTKSTTLPVGVVPVHPEAGHLLPEQVPQNLLEQAEVLPDQAGRRGPLALGLEVGPQFAQVGDVVHQVLVLLADGGGADDEALAGQGVALDQRAQPFPLLGIDDLAGDAHVLDARHEHQVPAREADVPGTGAAPCCRSDP